MNRTAAIAAAVATFCAGLSSLWAFFIGSLMWAQGGGAVQAVFGGLLVAFFFLLSGIFLCNAIWPRTGPARQARVRAWNEPRRNPRPVDYPKDFEVTNDRGNGNFDVRRQP